MVFKNLCILVLWTEVASAVEGLSLTLVHAGQASPRILAEHISLSIFSGHALPAAAALVSPGILPGHKSRLVGGFIAEEI